MSYGCRHLLLLQKVGALQDIPEPRIQEAASLSVADLRWTVAMDRDIQSSAVNPRATASTHALKRTYKYSCTIILECL